MPRLTAKMQPDERAAIYARAKRRRVTHSEAVRELVALGLGWPASAADAVNVEFRRWAKALLDGRERPEGRPRGGELSATVGVRVPAAWRSAVLASGGLAAVLRAGLSRAK